MGRIRTGQSGNTILKNIVNIASFIKELCFLIFVID